MRQCAFGTHGAMPDGGEDAFDRVRRSEMIPMLGREVEEGQQRLAVPGQAVDGLRISRTMLVDEGGGLGRRPVRRVPDPLI